MTFEHGREIGSVELVLKSRYSRHIYSNKNTQKVVIILKFMPVISIGKIKKGENSISLQV